MKITPNLVAWQLEGYPRSHAARANLLVHLITVPLFVVGVLMVPFLPLVAVPLAIVAFLCQGIGHKREHNAPEPFRSPLDVLARIFVEQFVTFPRFVLSGGFARAWRTAAKGAAA